MHTNRIYLTKFWLSLLLCLGGGWLAGLVTQQGVKHWYPHLIKPYGTPPDLVFPIVWTILYFFMAVALTLLWTSETKHKKTAFVFFILQLFLNFIWSPLFFYLQRPDLALLDIAFLWIAVFLTILSFQQHTRCGSYLLWPYLAWITYACYLNWFIWRHN